MKTIIDTDWTILAGMERYVQPGNIIDSDSEIVKKTVKSLTYGVQTQKEAIRLIFHYVRDDIKYGRISLYTKASDVIRAGKGNCTNKSIVFAAMLRAINIPAQIHYLSIKKSAIIHIISPFMARFTPDVVPLNARVDVFLDGKWITLETEFDPELYRGLRRQNLIPPLDIHWDGENSMHMLNAYNVKDLGADVSPEKYLDEVFQKLSPLKQLATPIAWSTSNNVLKKHRKKGRL